MRSILNGSQAIAMGAVAAGCDFFAGYPITPASEILTHMLNEMPRTGGVAIQAEDEIASIGMCIGAAMAGRRVMTATSGPGISLYSENIGLAIMGEVPIVIVDVQRMGPATGGATTVAQGDVQFLRWGTSGGYPVIVLAPQDAADCYSLTMRAFDLAERFRTPVFIATDKESALSLTTVEVEDLQKYPVRARKLASPNMEFCPYRVKPPEDVPPMTPLGGPHILRFTTSTHDERGHLTKDPLKVNLLNRRLASKIEDHLEEICLVRDDLQSEADTLILSYGVSSKAAHQAATILRQEGRRISEMAVISLWPVPEAHIRRAMDGIRRIIVPELNLGQYRREIERLAVPGQQVIGVQRVDGELITAAEIIERGGLL
jgi:2-oxoglutarate/2-oxoacid ferredoxin oxidoreductase subunit alpha